MATRRTPAGSRATMDVPHAQRVYDRYKAASAFIPFADQGIINMFPSTVARLAVRMVMNAIRAHYYGSKFAEDEKRPEDRNAIEYFFEMNRKERMFVGFPRSKLAPGFIYLSETDLVHILFTDEAKNKSVAYRIFQRILGCPNAKSAEKKVVDRKGFLIQQLFFRTNSSARLNDYHRKVSLQSDRSDTRFKLRGTISTNGLVLNIQAYDMTAERPRSTRDTASIIGSSGDDDDEFADLLNHEGADFNTDPMFLGSDEEEEEEGKEKDLQLDSGSDKQFDYQNINWKRGSKMLQNVELRFAERDKCTPIDKTLVIGLDPGEVNTVTATKIDPKDHSRHSIKITRKFLYRPYALYRRLLQARKKDAGIDSIESGIPPMTLDGINEYLTFMSSPVDGSGVGSMTNRSKLYQFYDNAWFLRKTWDVRKAQQCSIDLGVKAILGMAGANETRKKATDDDRPVVFAVGLGAFNTRTGLPSKHTSFLKRFIVKAKSLGHTVVGCHEFYTSAKCPRVGCHNFLEGAGKRSKHCRHCQAFLDRDIVGSENIANICRHHLEHQARPDDFNPSSTL